jgi:hypothetical protein
MKAKATAKTTVGMSGRPTAVPITMPEISPIAQPVRQCSVATAALLQGTRGGGPPAAAGASLAGLAVISVWGTGAVNTAMVQTGWNCHDGQVTPRLAGVPSPVTPGLGACGMTGQQVMGRPLGHHQCRSAAVLRG